MPHGAPLTCWHVILHTPQSLSKWGAGGAAALPGPPEPDKLCLWMDLFSLDSVILIVVTWNIVCHFHGREIGWSTVCANSKQKVS